MSKSNVDMHSGRWTPPDFCFAHNRWDCTEDHMTKLTVAKPVLEAERVESEDDRPSVGSWWWVRGSDASADDYDRGRQWLGCVIEVGSNYAKLQGVRYSTRIALDDMPEECVFEPNPQAFLDAKVDEHRTNVRELMGEIQRVCHQLGVPMHQALAEAETTANALVVAHETTNVKTYKNALVKAKDKTLPELFKQVREQHERMATWMKAELIPAEAELSRAKEITKRIDDKIHTVELYAGLQEDLVQVRKGKAAPADTKVRLMQRRHYMDEECLARYEAGGMDFEDIEAFDKWLARDENMTRLLPHERCIVAFRIRRWDKDYEVGDSLARFLKFRFHNQYNKTTFLYIRNGRQLWRMETSVEFGSELFPSREDSELIGDDELWVKPQEHDWRDKFISGRQRVAMIEHWKLRRREAAMKLWAWKRAGKPDEDTYWLFDPTGEHPTRICADTHDWPVGVSLDLREWGRPYGSENISAEWKSYRRVTPENIYYDDAMKHIARASFEHNRIAVIVQGLLDRSTCLHPHPPWRIWTSEGFAQGIELVYDVSRAITPGEEPDWHGYRAQLNKSVRVGAVVIGQYAAWDAEMEARYGERERWRARSKHGDGPKRLDRVVAIRGGKACFEWTRESQRAEWIPADRPGYVKRHYKTLTERWWCPIEELTCIDAYTPGDFRMFFDDPRTRADYIKWAPILLSAEDWHHARRTAPDTLAEIEED